MNIPRRRWWSIQPPAFFLVVSLCLGLAVLAINPPFQAADEAEHYLRVFQLSAGEIVGHKSGGVVGERVPALVLATADTGGLPFHSDRKATAALWRKAHPFFVRWSREPWVFCDLPHTILYPPAGYLPQTLGIIAGRLAWIGPLGLMYLARLFGFAASVGLSYAALRIMPFYRWSMTVFLLCPMNLYLMGSIASDGFLISAACLLAALAVRLAAAPGRPARPGETVLALGLSSVISVAKLVYFPLCAAALLLFLVRLPERRQRFLLFAGIMAVCVVPMAAWSRVIASVWLPGRAGYLLDPPAQLIFIAKSPLTFLRLVSDTIGVQGPNLYGQFVGVLGWLDAPLPEWFYASFGWSLLACLLIETSALVLPMGAAVLLLAASLATVVLIFAAQYADWNELGSLRPIEGIEGRYFLPVAPFVLVCFPAFLKFKLPGWAAPLGAAAGLAAGAVCLYAVIARYYIP